MIINSLINVVKAWPVAKTIFVAGTTVSATAAGVIAGKIYSGNRKRVADIEGKVRMIYSDLYEDSNNESYAKDDDVAEDIVDLGFVPSKEDVDAAT